MTIVAEINTHTHTYIHNHTYTYIHTLIRWMPYRGSSHVDVGETATTGDNPTRNSRADSLACVTTLQQKFTISGDTASSTHTVTVRLSTTWKVLIGELRGANRGYVRRTSRPLRPCCKTNTHTQRHMIGSGLGIGITNSSHLWTVTNDY